MSRPHSYQHAFHPDMQVGAESNLNSPTPRVALDGGPLSCVYEWVLEPVFLVDCEVRGMSSVLADQVVGAVCVLDEPQRRRRSQRSVIFLGVFSVGDNFSWGI